MKKNKMLRLASALAILAMLTTSIISGTYAKYTTTGSASDTARVAKWGVVITTSGSLYSDAYAITTDLPTAWTATPKADAITVAAITEDVNVVAPGTKSVGGLNFGISGQPEVAVRIKATIKAEDIYLKAGTYGVLVPTEITDALSLAEVKAATNHSGIYALKSGTYTKVKNSDAYDATSEYYLLTNKVTATDYFPVQYTLTDAGSHPTDNTAVKIATVLAGSIKSGAAADAGNTNYKVTYTEITNTYDPNTILGTAGPLHGEQISWIWKYNDGKDAEDTILGDMIAAREATTAPDYVVVTVDTANNDAVTVVEYATGEDYTATADGTIVANLRTKFDISLTAEQAD